jgi:putative heme-binding domain-containing protein
MSARKKLLSGIVAALAGPLLLFAQPEVSVNPYTSAEDVAAGGRMFRSHCAECHGLDGSGGRGSNLTSGRFRHGDSDEDLYRVIGSGIPGSEMPGIYFNGRQLWQLAAYVRSLSEGATRTEATGDAASGAALFSGRGGCQQCHRVNGEGARLGPDLSDIGGKRSPGHLRRSLLEPSQSVAQRFWMVRAVTKDNRRIAGFLLNEDSFSLQILEINETLRSLPKSGLASWEVDRQSTMPSYGNMLSGREIDDLIAYLQTLRGTEVQP